jgi:hypothetical protein
MKRILLISLISFFIFSCNKEDESMNTESLPTSVYGLTYSYDSDSRTIDISWQYNNTGEIKMFEVYYSPGGGTSFHEVSPNQTYFWIENVQANANYLFNVRVVDKYDTRSESQVIYVDTSEEE